MNTEIIVITQKHVGTALLKATKNIFGILPISTIPVAVNYRADPEQLFVRLKNIIKDIPEKHKILILTDLYGSTASNIATRLYEYAPNRCHLVTGLNLPMLVNIMNYPELELEELAHIAVSGGQQGVFDLKSENISC